jgi:hypothetical protein
MIPLNKGQDIMPLPALTKRLVKGSPLTAAEGDNNLTALQTFVDGLETRIGISVAADGTLKKPVVQYGESGVGTSAYAVTLAGISALGDLTGVILLVKADVANISGASTLTINSTIGPYAIYKQKNQPIVNGDIKAGQICVLIYDATATKFELLNPSSSPLPSVYAVDTGVANAYIAEVGLSGNQGVPAAYSAGFMVFFKCGATNTNATVNLKVKFNYDTGTPLDLGNQLVKKYINGAVSTLDIGDLVAGQLYCLVYDGTNWQLLNPNNQPNQAKAWVVFDASSVIKRSYNVATVTSSATGEYVITFTNPMPNADYVAVGGVSNSGNPAGNMVVKSQTVSVLTVNTGRTDTGSSLLAYTRNHVIVFG